MLVASKYVYVLENNFFSCKLFQPNMFQNDHVVTCLLHYEFCQKYSDTNRDL